MNFLRWLHKNEFVVHMLVMSVVFYAIPGIIAFTLYPNLVQPLVTAMLSGLVLLSIGAISFRVAVLATDAVKSALDRAVLRDIESQESSSHRVIDRVVDYTSSNVLVVEENLSALKDAVAAMGEVGSAIAPVSEADAGSTSIAPKRRRGRPSKSERGEG